MNGYPRFAWRRIVAAVVVGEVVPIVALVSIVAIAGPSDPAESDAFARRLGTWVGPLVGAATILALSLWAGRRSSEPVVQGLLIGAALAAIDIAILVMLGEPFARVFVASNGGKVAAGALGGWIATRSRGADAVAGAVQERGGAPPTVSRFCCTGSLPTRGARR